MSALRKCAAIFASALAAVIGGCGPSAQQRQTAVENAFAGSVTNQWPAELKHAFNPHPQDKKPALITFTATWCGPCKVLDAEIRSHERLKAEAEQWNTVTVDIDRHPSLARQFLIEGLPTILLVDAHSKSVGRIDRYVSADDLLSRMQTFRSRLSTQKAAR